MNAKRKDEKIHASHSMPVGDDYKIRNNKRGICRGCGAAIGTDPTSAQCGSSFSYDTRLIHPCKAAKG